MRFSDVDDPDITPGKVIKWGIIGLLVVAVLVLAGTLIFAPVKMVADGANTVVAQYSPSVMLKKYEWFKDAASALDAKNADIQVLNKRTKNMDEMYKGTPRKDWPRSDLEQYNQWSNEVAGVILSYNALASDYNAQMSKFNWAFCNAGTLPKGATEVLPRDFRSYKTE